MTAPLPPIQPGGFPATDAVPTTNQSGDGVDQFSPVLSRARELDQHRSGPRPSPAGDRNGPNRDRLDPRDRNDRWSTPRDDHRRAVADERSSHDRRVDHRDRDGSASARSERGEPERTNAGDRRQPASSDTDRGRPTDERDDTARPERTAGEATRPNPDDGETTSPDGADGLDGSETPEVSPDRVDAGHLVEHSLTATGGGTDGTAVESVAAVQSAGTDHPTATADDAEAATQPSAAGHGSDAHPPATGTSDAADAELEGGSPAELQDGHATALGTHDALARTGEPPTVDAAAGLVTDPSAPDGSSTTTSDDGAAVGVAGSGHDTADGQATAPATPPGDRSVGAAATSAATDPPGQQAPVPIGADSPAGPLVDPPAGLPAPTASATTPSSSFDAGVGGLGVESTAAATGTDTSAMRLERATDPSGSAATAPLTDGDTDEVWAQVQRALHRVRSGPDGTELRLRLHPAELGELLIQVRAQGEQLSVRLVTSSTAAQQTLLSDQQRLAAELADAGFADGTVDIGQWGGSAGGDGRPDHDDPSRGESSAQQQLAGSASGDRERAASAGGPSQRRHAGLVDLTL